MIEKKPIAKKTAGKAILKGPTKEVVPMLEKPRNMLPHELLTSPNLQNAIGVYSWGKFAGDADLGQLVKDLREEVKKVVQDGDMKPAEAMLYGQAMTLQTIFTNLARRAASNDGLKQFQVNMTLALKAQAQCRATIEALALLKNPQPYIQQANIAQGHQQINNTYAMASGHDDKSTNQNLPSSCAADFQHTPNKLLESAHGQRLDIGAPGAPSRANQVLEAVGAVHRA